MPALRGPDRRDARHARILHHAVAEGMVVHTQTDEIARIRKGVMELLHQRPPAGLPRPAPPMAIANCRIWRARWACARCALTPAPTISTRAEAGPNPEYRPGDQNPYFTF